LRRAVDVAAGRRPLEGAVVRFLPARWAPDVFVVETDQVTYDAALELGWPLGRLLGAAELRRRLWWLLRLGAVIEVERANGSISSSREWRRRGVR